MVLITHKKGVSSMRTYNFRPLAGIMVLIDRYKAEMALYLKENFRPLAGIMVLIDSSWREFEDACTKFPSPCGDYGSYRLALWLYHKVVTVLFPSPCGDYGSYRTVSPMVSSITKHHFRPLAGIMVLIRTLYRWLYEAVEMAFCGADHIFSSFFVFCKKMIFKKSFRLEF